MNTEDFTSVIVDEAIARESNAANYGSGWTFKPFHFAVSDQDLLPQLEEEESMYYQVSQELTETKGDGNVWYELRDDLINTLCEYNTDQFNTDNTDNKFWYEASFTSLEGQKESVTHTINIPGNVLDTTKEIKTIVFLYENNFGKKYVHAVARANKKIIYTPGITQTYVFQFTISKTREVTSNNLIVNYTYPQDISDHNNAYSSDSNFNNVHPFLLDTEGVRKANQILHYNEPKDYTNESANAIVDKGYVDAIIDIVMNQVCPPGSLMWWTGSVEDIPSGWTIRDGKVLWRRDNPVLWQRLNKGEKYRAEYFAKEGALPYNYRTYIYEPGDTYYVKENDTEQFPIMDDRALFIRASEVTDSSNNGRLPNSDLLFGTEVGGKQVGGAPEISGIAGTSWFSQKKSRHPYIGSTQITGCFGVLPNANDGGSVRYYGVNDKCVSNNDPGMDFKASRCSSEYKEDLKEVRPVNRNYIPLIRLG